MTNRQDVVPKEYRQDPEAWLEQEYLRYARRQGDIEVDYARQVEKNRQRLAQAQDTAAVWAADSGAELPSHEEMWLRTRRRIGKRLSKP